MKRILNPGNNFFNFGLLLLRIGLGIMFMTHGFPKLIHGPDTWIKLGSVMGIVGIKFGYVFWGFMAAFAEFFGGIFLLLGLGFRVAILFMLFDMIMAVCMHANSGDNLGIMSHAIEDGIVFLALLFMGPGKFSVDHLIFQKK
jgi:putative oxidoreductase